MNRSLMKKPLPANLNDLNAVLAAAAAETRGRICPEVPRTPRNIAWHANRAFDEAAPRKSIPDDLTPVDMVQCHQCGHHWNYSERKLCPVCFEE
jgi:hypothetical protein